jgi:hypothetical protein
MARTEPGSDAWLALHGIDPNIFWNTRGARRYDVGDTWVKDEFAPWLGDQEGKLRWLQGIVNQEPGIFMPKTPPPGYNAIPPQLRPDVAVYTDRRPSWHYHGESPHWPRMPDGSWPRTPTYDLEEIEAVDPETGEGLGVFTRTGGGRPLRVHGKKAEIMRADAVERHVAKAVKDGGHGGINPTDVHLHPARPRKYIFPPIGDRLKRIEMSTLAQKRWRRADRVFLVQEGSLKNDAVLSAGEAAVNIASVSMWSKNELWRFAKEFCVGKYVVVVPDADWFDNWQVYSEALLIRELLREVRDDRGWGVDDAVIAASPIDFFREVPDDRGEFTLKGVDDYLGTKGAAWARRRRRPGGIAGLEERGREPAEAIRGWPGAYFERQGLRQLSLHAGLRDEEKAGELRRSPQGMARILGVSIGNLPARLDVLRGAYDLNGSTAVERRAHTFKNARDQDDEIVRWEWVDPPSIRLHPEYHAIEQIDKEIA